MDLDRRVLCGVGKYESLLSIHIWDEMRHGISDTPESLPAPAPRVDPQDRLYHISHLSINLCPDLAPRLP